MNADQSAKMIASLRTKLKIAAKILFANGKLRGGMGGGGRSELAIRIDFEDLLHFNASTTLNAEECANHTRSSAAATANLLRSTSGIVIGNAENHKRVQSNLGRRAFCHGWRVTSKSRVLKFDRPDGAKPAQNRARVFLSYTHSHYHSVTVSLSLAPSQPSSQNRSHCCALSGEASLKMSRKPNFYDLPEAGDSSERSPCNQFLPAVRTSLIDRHSHFRAPHTYLSSR